MLIHSFLKRINNRIPISDSGIDFRFLLFAKPHCKENRRNAFQHLYSMIFRLQRLMIIQLFKRLTFDDVQGVYHELLKQKIFLCNLFCCEDCEGNFQNLICFLYILYNRIMRCNQTATIFSFNKIPTVQIFHLSDKQCIEYT